MIQTPRLPAWEWINSEGACQYVRTHVEHNHRDELGQVANFGVGRYTRITFPHEVTSGSYDKPAIVEYLDVGGSTLRKSGFALEVETSYDPRANSPASLFTNEVSRTLHRRSLSGQLLEQRVWHDLDGNGHYTWEWEYDALGRMIKSIDPEGGITQHFTGTESGYDSLDRVLLTAVGREGAGGEPVVVSRTYFDSPGFAKVQGVGNGVATLTVAPTGETTGIVEFQTRNYFDWRDRVVGQENVAIDGSQVARLTQPATVYDLDNLGRRIASASFDSPFGGSLPGVAPAATAVGYSETYYSDRGLPYKQVVAIDPTLPLQSSDGAVTGQNVLETNAWYDALGRPVAVWAPSGPGKKMEYDAHGRVKREYTTDRGGDLYPGVSGSYADADPALTGLVGDRVLEQVEYVYELYTGHLLYTEKLVRRHDDTGTGSLTPMIAVPSYSAAVYDSAGRSIHMLNYGTSSASGFVSLATAFQPAPVQGIDPASFRLNNPTALVRSVVYDSYGRIRETVDPMGRHTLSKYDDMGRVVATIESAAVTGPSAIGVDDIVWDVAAGRWEVVAGQLPLPDDQNRVKSSVYDGNSNVIKRVAHERSGSVQETRYVFGTSVGASSNDGDSLIASTSLLAEVHYPDESTGDAGAARSDKLLFAYDRLGAMRFKADQNQTEHVYERYYDASQNRIETDTASLLGVGIDGAVRRLERTFDVRGRLKTARSYDAVSAGSVVNAVQFDYDDLGNTTSVIQDPTGDIDPSDLGIDYTHVSTPPVKGVADVSEGNFVRRSGIRYPADVSDTLSYDYGPAGSIDDRISRVAELAEGLSGLDLVTYKYAGLGLPVVVEYPVIDLKLARDIEIAGNGTSATGYPAFDQFGRAIRHAWISQGPSGNLGAAVDRRYTYDKNANRLSNFDGGSTRVRDVDWELTYDGLNRLDQSDRGRFDALGAPQFNIAPGSKKWELDHLGNWGELYVDSDGDGDFQISSETREFREHGSTNEVNSVRTDTWNGTSWDLAPSVRSMAHDDAGNRTANDARGVFGDGAEPFVYTYDAWNRLVKAEREVDDVGPPAVVVIHTVGEYEYNALSWRTRKRADTVSNGDYDGLDQQRTFYWSTDWQLLEEHVENDSGGLFGPTNNDSSYKSRQFWGARYVDDAVAKRIDRGDDGFSVSDDRYFYLTDAQFSVVALIDDDAQPGIVERLDYSPYGVPRRRSVADSRTSGVTGDAVYFPDGIFAQADITGFTSEFNLQTADGDFAAPFGQWDLDDITQFNQEFGDANAAPGGWLSDPRDVVGASPGTDNAFGYAGYHHDSEIKMYAQRNRTYDPESGRWLQRDPLGYVDGMSLYEYARSSPSGFTDPFGLKGCVPGEFETFTHTLRRSLKEPVGPRRRKSYFPLIDRIFPIYEDELVKPEAEFEVYVRDLLVLDVGVAGRSVLNNDVDNTGMLVRLTFESFNWKLGTFENLQRWQRSGSGAGVNGEGVVSLDGVACRKLMDLSVECDCCGCGGVRGKLEENRKWVYGTLKPGGLFPYYCDNSEGLVRRRAQLIERCKRSCP